MPLEESVIQDLILTATAAARMAGQIALDRLTRERVVEIKGFRDIVTDADVAAQRVIVDHIRAQYPEHGYLTEEDEPGLPTSGPVIWIIDPIDGTTNYSRGVPLFCVSIAAVVADSAGTFQPIAGVVFDPSRDELFSAGHGLGARLNDQLIRASEVDSLANALISTDFGQHPAIRAETFTRIEALSHEANTIRAVGSAVLAMAWVAAGRLDAYVNNALKPWDWAAGHVLVEEAGGRVSSLTGQLPHLDHKDTPGLASNNPLHNALLTSLQR